MNNNTTNTNMNNEGAVKMKLVQMVKEAKGIILEVEGKQTKVELNEKLMNLITSDKIESGYVNDDGIAILRKVKKSNKKHIITSPKIAQAKIRKYVSKKDSHYILQFTTGEEMNEHAKINASLIRAGEGKKEMLGLLEFQTEGSARYKAGYKSFSETEKFCKDIINIDFTQEGIAEIARECLDGQIIIKEQPAIHVTGYEVYAVYTEEVSKIDKATYKVIKDKDGNDIKESRRQAVNLATLSNIPEEDVDALFTGNYRAYEYFSNSPSAARQGKYDAILMEENGVQIRTQDDLENLYMLVSCGSYKYALKDIENAKTIEERNKAIANAAVRTFNGDSPQKQLGELKSVVLFTGKIGFEDLTIDGQGAISGKALSRELQSVGIEVSESACSEIELQARAGADKAFLGALSSKSMKFMFQLLSKKYEVVYIDADSDKFEEMVDAEYTYYQDKNANKKIIVFLNGQTKEEFLSAGPEKITDFNATKQFTCHKSMFKLTVLDMPKNDYTWNANASTMLLEKAAKYAPVKVRNFIMNRLDSLVEKEINEAMNPKFKIVAPEDLNEYGAITSAYPEVIKTHSQFAEANMDNVLKGMDGKFSRTSTPMMASFRRVMADLSILLNMVGILDKKENILKVGEVYVPGYEKIAKKLIKAGYSVEQTKRGFLLRYPSPETEGYLAIEFITKEEMESRIENAKFITTDEEEIKSAKALLKDYFLHSSAGVLFYDGSETTAAILGGMDNDFDGLFVVIDKDLVDILAGRQQTVIKINTDDLSDPKEPIMQKKGILAAKGKNVVVVKNPLTANKIFRKAFYQAIKSGNLSVGELTNYSTAVNHMQFVMAPICVKVAKGQQLTERELESVEKIKNAITKDLSSRFQTSFNTKSKYIPVLNVKSDEKYRKVEITKEKEYEIVSRALSMDVDNVNNLYAYLVDIGLVYRRYQELTIDAVKKNFLVEVLFTPGKYCTSLGLAKYAFTKDKETNEISVEIKRSEKKDIICDPIGEGVHRSTEVLAEKIKEAFDKISAITLSDDDKRIYEAIYGDFKMEVEGFKNVIVKAWHSAINLLTYNNDKEEEYDPNREAKESENKRKYKELLEYIVNTVRLYGELKDINPVLLVKVLDTAARHTRVNGESAFTVNSKCITNLMKEEFLLYAADTYGDREVGYPVTLDKCKDLKNGEVLYFVNGQNSRASLSVDFTGYLTISLTDKGIYAVTSLVESVHIKTNKKLIVRCKGINNEAINAAEQLKGQIVKLKKGSVIITETTEEGKIVNTSVCKYYDGMYNKANGIFGELYDGMTVKIDNTHLTLPDSTNPNVSLMLAVSIIETKAQNDEKPSFEIDETISKSIDLSDLNLDFDLEEDTDNTSEDNDLDLGIDLDLEEGTVSQIVESSDIEEVEVSEETIEETSKDGIEKSSKELNLEDIDMDFDFVEFKTTERNIDASGVEY